MPRPFKVSYPVVPAISLVMAVFCFISFFMASFDVVPYAIGVYVVALAYYFIWGNKHIRPFADEFGSLNDLDK